MHPNPNIHHPILMDTSSGEHKVGMAKPAANDIISRSFSSHRIHAWYTPENQHDNRITTMNEHVSPVNNDNFPFSHVSLQGGYICLHLRTTNSPDRLVNIPNMEPMGIFGTPISHTPSAIPRSPAMKGIPDYSLLVKVYLNVQES